MKTLHGGLGPVRGGGDVAFALSVLAVVALLVTALGPRALDALLAVNLAVAATVLVVTLFARDALRLASFPTLLLLTTLFRLALNVCTTRLVLSRGEAGRVIEAFGRVVVQGDIVSLLISYLVCTVEQMLADEDDGIVREPHCKSKWHLLTYFPSELLTFCLGLKEHSPPAFLFS